MLHITGVDQPDLEAVRLQQVDIHTGNPGNNLFLINGFDQHGPVISSPHAFTN